MGIGTEFKEFAMKGNVIDLAVGVVIGAAFGKIVSSLVADVIMPPLGLAIGGVDFKEYGFNLATGVDGKAVVLKYGVFLQTILPNAAPITTPTARSMTLPFIANSLNSVPRAMAISPNVVLDQRGDCARGQRT